MHAHALSDAVAADATADAGADAGALRQHARRVFLFLKTRTPGERPNVHKSVTDVQCSCAAAAAAQVQLQRVI